MNKLINKLLQLHMFAVPFILLSVSKVIAAQDTGFVCLKLLLSGVDNK